MPPAVHRGTLEYNPGAFNPVQCTRFYNATSTRYNVVTWHLHIWTDVGFSTSTWRSSYAISSESKVPILRDTVVTVDAIKVRYEEFGATHTPSWKVPYGPFDTSYVGYWRDYYGLDDDDSPGISPKVRKLLLGLCIPLGILFFSVIAYVIRYIRHRRTRSKASSRDPAGSSGSVATESGEAAQTEDKQMREPTHREVFMAERCGSLPPGSTDDHIQPESEDRRRLRYWEESLRERRAQLKAEEEALRMKTAQRRSGM